VVAKRRTAPYRSKKDSIPLSLQNPQFTSVSVPELLKHSGRTNASFFLSSDFRSSNIGRMPNFIDPTRLRNSSPDVIALAADVLGVQVGPTDHDEEILEDGSSYVSGGLSICFEHLEYFRSK
jgi:hypothetical protein